MLKSNMENTYKKEDIDIYRKIALDQVNRLLGMGDRNPASLTYGCYDRNYWHYRIIDFANSRFQEICLMLSILYKYDFIDNRYFSKERIKDWAVSAIAFWVSIQKNNGSFDEVYPYENSFIATSFTTSAVTDAILTLGGVNGFEKALIKAGSWILSNDNPDVSNQRAASIYALFNIYRITGDDNYRKASGVRLESLLDTQSSAGFFPEYGGGDIGYQSITVKYLKKYRDAAKDEKINSYIDKATGFISSNLDESANFDPSLFSRHTQYIYPTSICEDKSLCCHIRGLLENNTINPQWMDNRFALPLTIDYLEMYLSCG